MININFKSENFKIDFLSFNTQLNYTQFNDEKQIQIIADYFSNKFKCNSQFEDKQNPNLNRTLVNKKENYLKVFFRVNQVKYWSGISIDFTGNNANDFYESIKSTKLDWNILNFKHTNLGRIDVCYDRKIKYTDQKEDFNLFLESCKNKINNKFPTTKVEINENILRVGSRKSPNFFRVYKKQNAREIRFELEIKKLIAKKYQFYLFSNQFEKFESILSKHFYRQAVKILVINSSYTDWLLHNFRKGKNLPAKKSFTDSLDSLVTSYFSNKSLNDLEKEEILYRLLQLLNYIRTLQNSIESIDNQNYRMVSFTVNSFLEFTGQHKTNKYQIRKILNFLQSIQKSNLLIEHFLDSAYQSAVAFPYFKITKERRWYVKLAIAEELYFYNYPFNFPKTFLTYKNIYDLRVKLLVIKSFAITDVQKLLPIEDFLLQFNVPNSNITKLKKYILDLIHQLRDSNLIESKYIILTKENKILIVEKLTIHLMTKSKYILYTENSSCNHF